jgi:hypothetical protein
MVDRQQQNSWWILCQELQDRFRAPAGQVTFGVFLLVGIVTCGGAPVWVELVKFLAGATPDTENIRTAMNCYFPAIGCAAAVQLAFAGESRQKYLTAFSYLATFFFFISSILTLLLEKRPATCRAWVIGIVLSLLAIATWWIANGRERTFQDFDPSSALGGEPQKSLSGDTSGFAI